MKAKTNTILLWIGFTILPMAVCAQSQADTLLLFEKSIGIPDLQKYYPVDASGNYKVVNIMQYPVHLNIANGSTYTGKEIRVYQRTEITESKVESFCSFRSVEIGQNDARISFSYFYDYDYTNRRFKVLSVNASFVKVKDEWNIADTNIKGDVK